MRHASRPLTIAAAAVLLAGCAVPGSGASGEAPASSSRPDAEGDVITVASAETDAGPSLVGPDGLTLYIFTSDTDGTSTCYEDCAATWPPFEVEAGATLEAGDGVTGEIGTTEREDGTTQVTYEGMPLYFYASDTEPGDAIGEGVGGVWFIASPDGHTMAEPSDSDGAAPSPSYDYDY
jgi:predicted lipoprotein with Yx(FWY)xxD motif